VGHSGKMFTFGVLLSDSPTWFLDRPALVLEFITSYTARTYLSLERDRI